MSHIVKKKTFEMKKQKKSIKRATPEQAIPRSPTNGPQVSHGCNLRCRHIFSRYEKCYTSTVKKLYAVVTNIPV